MSERQSEAYPGGETETAILLVEDNAMVREALAVTLQFLGYQVYDAANGSEALAISDQTLATIRLVISDLVMPGINALELYEALQHRQYRGGMLVITGYPMPYAGMTLVERPGVAWASKPIRHEELQLLLAQML